MLGRITPYNIEEFVFPSTLLWYDIAMLCMCLLYIWCCCYCFVLNCLLYTKEGKPAKVFKNICGCPNLFVIFITFFYINTRTYGLPIMSYLNLLTHVYMYSLTLDIFFWRWTSTLLLACELLLFPCFFMLLLLLLPLLLSPALSSPLVHGWWCHICGPTTI